MSMKLLSIQRGFTWQHEDKNSIYNILRKGAASEQNVVFYQEKKLISSIQGVIFFLEYRKSVFAQTTV